MYDYRLWIELSESTEESDCGRLDAKAEDLQKFVDEKLNCKPHQCIFDLNCTKIFQCAGSANHRGTDHDALLAVLRHLVGSLPGSHGLVYWSDDENPGYSSFDGYRVIVIARGEIHERFDPFLSPKTPTIED